MESKSNMIKRLHLFSRKDRRKEKERERGQAAVVVEKQRGRRFKLDIKNRFVVILVYYKKLYIIYTLTLTG
jgi:hypothetical protein